MRVAFFSDIHEDINSLVIAVEKAESLNCDKLVCLGDISGFAVPYYNHTRDAAACLSLIRKRCSFITLGNHDLYAAKLLPPSTELFEFPPDWYELDYLQRKELAKGQIWLHEENELPTLYGKDDLTFLSEQKLIHQTLMGENAVLLSHYCYPNISGIFKEFMINARDFETHLNLMKNRNCKLAFIGHEHPEGFRIVKNGKISNYSFKSHKLDDSFQLIVCPPIVRGKGKNGFLIFDSEKLEIKAIRI